MKILRGWRDLADQDKGACVAFGAFGAFTLAGLDDLRARDTSAHQAFPLDLTADLGIKLDTHIGIFTVSVGNLLGRIPAF